MNKAEMTKIYSVTCRGSMNEKTAKCFQGGGWMVEALPAFCSHCGKEMFVTQTITIVSMRDDGQA